MTELLRCLEIGPGADADGAVVWLHGLGASGHDFEDVVPMFELPRVRFVLPHAPSRGVTINMGLIMPAWYDIVSLGGRGAEDEVDVRESAAQVAALVDRERERGVPSGQIVLAGFSQGGALALHVGTRYSEKLGGILVLSGYEVLADTREVEQTDANRATPMLFCHGSLDPLVGVHRGREAHGAHASGRDAQWREFPIEHEVSLEEIEAIRAWLKALFGKIA